MRSGKTLESTLDYLSYNKAIKTGGLRSDGRIANKLKFLIHSLDIRLIYQNKKKS